MKYIKRFMVAWLLILLVTPSAWPAKRPSAFQREATVNRQTTFNNVTDFFATLGKSDNEKRRIKRQRKMQRKKARLHDALDNSRGEKKFLGIF